MEAPKTISTVAVLLLTGLYAAERTANPPISARFESLTVSDLTPDHVELSLTVAVSSTMRVKLKSIRFEGMRLNDIPIYIGPVREKLELDPAAAPRPVRLEPILIYYRDLDRLDPVRRMVANQAAELNGLGRLDVEISPLQKILLFGPNLRVIAPLHQKMAVTLPGGSITRKTALAALAAVDTAIRLGEETVNRVKEHFGWTGDLTRQYSQSLLQIETRYRYTIAGHAATRTVKGVGFRIQPDRFVTTAELIRPWLYDPELAHLLHSGAAILDDSMYDLRVTPSGQTLAKQQLRIIDAGSGTEKILVTTDGKLHGVEVGRRDLDRNLAIIEFNGQPPRGTSMPATASSTKEWDHAALFRPRAGSPANFEVIYVRARRVENRIELLDPTDSTAFGSPLVVPEGMVGMVQSESTAALLSRALKQ